METMRSFIALELDSGTKDFLEDLITRWRGDYPSAKWVRKDQFHVTLAFFPEFPRERTEDVEQILIVLGRRFPLFQTEIAKVGVFPSWNRARVLWVGFDQRGEEQIKQIGKVLFEELEVQKIAVEEKKDLVPHITLARFRSPVSLVPAVYRLERVSPSVIQRVIFFQSTLTPQGPIYRELCASNLKECECSE